MHNKYNETNVAPEELTQQDIDEILEEKTVETVEEAADEAAKSEEPVSRIGEVNGCKKLNVRQAASINSTPVCVISEGDMVIISPIESTDEWYKVYTEAGAEGFCMKTYISIKE